MSNYNLYRTILISCYKNRISQLMLADMVEMNQDPKILESVARDLYWQYQKTLILLNNLFDKTVEGRYARKKKIGNHYLKHNKNPELGEQTMLKVMRKNIRKLCAIQKNIAAVNTRLGFFHDVWLTSIYRLRSGVRQ